MKHVPNILSSFRICLVPLFVVLFIAEYYVSSAAVVALSALTDIADGYIARKYSLVSVTGQVLDPLADKLMQLAIIIALWIGELIPLWAICIIVTKELVMILGGCILYFFKKKSAIPAMWYGKVSTSLFYFTVLYIILFQESAISSILIAVTVCFMVFSLVMYIGKFMSLSGNRKTTEV